jgi:hypothetical protein
VHQREQVSLGEMTEVRSSDPIEIIHHSIVSQNWQFCEKCQFTGTVR